eukprot:TRINITY_DN2415_c0_g1_i1.p1 TRINITY_DN2415_c0_g1~~TRINITY_DN2415_c0_g1_i1.p1  ORF type:complete len:927 (+),score=209.77 TRINITY_DN2415_c0_g1_i1:53-2833(+)
MSNYNFNLLSLSDEQVEASRKEHGTNDVPVQEVESFFEKLMGNFEDPLIKILLVALGITMVLAFFGYAEWFEGIGIAIAVFLATFVATYSEFKNEEEFQKLQQDASMLQNVVFRNGSAVTVFVNDIVVGDHVLLEAGDKIPADGPLVMGELSCNQFTITGESLPQRKFAIVENYQENEASLEGLDTEDTRSLLLRGAIIEEGEGILYVEKIGAQTSFGSMIDYIANVEERDSPLEAKLESLADTIAFLGYVGAVLIGLSFMFKQIVMDNNYDVEAMTQYIMQWNLVVKDAITALILGIIIIVVAVPEGLPMMIAIVLALNMRKLLKDQVLVRKLIGIETAGSMSILFSDKTGTITEGVLQPHVFLSGELNSYETCESIPLPLQKTIKFAVKNSSKSYVDEKGNISGGNSTERAFLGFIDVDYINKNEEVSKITEILFNSRYKYSGSSVKASEAVVAEYPAIFNGKDTASMIKGAPEILISKCSHYVNGSGNVVKLLNQQLIQEEVSYLSSQGTRVIALAFSNEALEQEDKSLPEGLVFVGCLGLLDEIRPESRDAINTAVQAGIQVVMVTGDRLETAASIAEEVGLLPKYIENEVYTESGLMSYYGNAVLSSSKLNKKSDEEIIEILPELRVIARASPSDKVRLVELSQKAGMVVGMTGDGTNDAAALNNADIGFGMGSGTALAREASDIVILDDNFNSILKAVLYGRTIFKSIRKFIIFQSTINLASTLIVFAGPFFGFDFPLTLIQLLWVNLVMDTLAAIAFGGEPSLERYMRENPVDRLEKIINPYMWSSILFNGIFVAVLSSIFLINDSVLSFFGNDEPMLLTAFFAFFIFITTVNAFNVRTAKINLLENITKNTNFIIVLLTIFVVQIIFTYVGGSYLRTVPITGFHWGFVIKSSFLIIPFDLLRKVFIVPLLPQAWRDEE